MRRKNIHEDEIEKRTKRASLAFPDAMVTNYESLIDTIALDDEKDRHVMAAAIKINANLIITNNLKHFPKEYLSTFGLSAKDPDDFITDLIDLNQEQAVLAFRDLVLNRRDPKMDNYQVLDRFRKRGLIRTADYLHSQI